MYKRVAIIAFLVIAVSGIGYFNFYYAESQSDLNKKFKKANSFVLDGYFNLQVNSCGIWYEGYDNNETAKGRNNEKVKKCFAKAFEKCEAKKILLVKEIKSEEKNSTIYSMIHVIKKNDRNECLIQSYYQEQFAVEGKEPISYINTCTQITEDLIGSCEPEYIKNSKK